MLRQIGNIADTDCGNGRTACSADLMTKLEKIGVKFVKDVDKSGFVKDAQPIQEQLAEKLGPGAVNVLHLVRDVK